ncbi:MAG: hypothetical protein OEU26_15150, partial [Candidatus Tectomicrobia bacterium]|nr:hypothetical protein [Candidatus Tectomicrobia bacterium]
VAVLDGISMRYVQMYLDAFRAAHEELMQLERTGVQDCTSRHRGILSSARVALMKGLELTENLTLHSFDVGLEHLIQGVWNELNFRSSARLQRQLKDRVLRAAEMLATLIRMLEAIVVLHHTHRDYNGHR